MIWRAIDARHITNKNKRAFKMHRTLKLTALILISTSFITACTNTQVANSTLIEQQALSKANKSEMTLEQAIDVAAETYSKALGDELMFFAPLHMERAKDKLDDAQNKKKNIETEEDKVAAISAAFEVKSLVEKAYKNKTIVEKQLAKVLDHKEVLLELKADSIQAKDYRKAIDKLSDLIKEIEGGFLTKAANEEPKVLAFFAEVEADTLRTIYLTDAIKMLDKADSVDADDFAAISYEKAEVAIDYADNFIEKHYRDREGVKRTTTAALNSASHAYHVSIEAQKILELDEEGAERRILYIEKLLQRINSEANVDNLMSLSLKDQVEAITDAIAAKAAKKMPPPPKEQGQTSDTKNSSKTIETEVKTSEPLKAPSTSKEKIKEKTDQLNVKTTDNISNNSSTNEKKD